MSHGGTFFLLGNRQRPLSLTGSFNSFSQTMPQTSALDLRKALDVTRLMDAKPSGPLAVDGYKFFFDKLKLKSKKKVYTFSSGTLSPKSPVSSRTISAPVSPKNHSEISTSQNSGNFLHEDCKTVKKKRMTG